MTVLWWILVGPIAGWANQVELSQSDKLQSNSRKIRYGSCKLLKGILGLMANTF